MYKIIGIKNTNISRKEIVDYSNFCLSKLVTNKLKNTLYIEYHIIDLDSKVLALTSPMNGDIYPKDFLIELSPILFKSKKQLYMTIGHELTHVKQFARRELILDHKVARWKNKKYFHQNKSYFDYPWEIEAWGRQHTLYMQYIANDRIIKTQGYL